MPSSPQHARSPRWPRARRGRATTPRGKQVFSLSVVVEHLLAGFFPDVAALLDLSTLADISGEWVHDGARRRGDSVWRVRYRDGSGRSLVLFLEFQSTVGADMARRVLRNIGMVAERLRRNRRLDADGRLRALCVVIHSGRRRWTAPGAAGHVAVDADGEVLSLLALPYAALDARRMAGEHLPERNLVSTLLALNGAPGPADAEPPLRNLGRWIDDLGEHAEPVRAAYAEWPATRMPTWFSPEDAAALVERTTKNGRPGGNGGRHGILGDGGQRAQADQARRAQRGSAKGWHGAWSTSGDCSACKPREGSATARPGGWNRCSPASATPRGSSGSGSGSSTARTARSS